MKFATSLAILSAASVLCSAEQTSKPNGITKTAQGPPAMCKAAALKLREAGTDQVAMEMTIDAKGRVLSFKTESPKGLRLEKTKKAADEIKAMRFDPAEKDGNPVTVMIRATFQCP